MKWYDIENIVSTNAEELLVGSLHNLGITVFYLTKEKPQALRILLSALEQEPDNERFQRSFSVVSTLLKDVDLDATLSGWTAILQRDPNNRRAADGLVKVLKLMAKGYKLKGDESAAISGWTAILERHPNVQTALHTLAKVYEDMNDVSAAIPVWTVILEHDPSYHRAIDGLTNALDYCKGEVDGIIACSMAVFQRDPSYWGMANALALAYERKSDVNGAISGLTRILDRIPGHWAAAESLVKAYERKGDVDGAISHLMAVLEQNPHHWIVADGLVKAYE